MGEHFKNTTTGDGKQLCTDSKIKKTRGYLTCYHLNSSPCSDENVIIENDCIPYVDQILVDAVLLKENYHN